MYIHNVLSLGAALAGTAVSQSTFQNDMSTDTSRSSVSAALMNITFAEPSSSNSRNNCGRDTSNRLTIAVRTIPQDQVCFNLGNTFSDPNSTYSMRGNNCDDNTICGVNYTITAARFSNDANYSSIAYTQIRNPFANNDNDDDERQGEGQRVGGRLEFQVYNGANCQRRDGVESRAWNCLSAEGECNAVPFAVQSFSIAMTDPEDVGSGNCSIAKTGGAGRLVGGGGGRGSVLGVALAVVGAMVLL